MASFPWDLVVFGVIVVTFFAVGLPLITRRVTVPRKVEFERVVESELSEGQRRIFDELDRDLADLGYRPAGDRRTLNMQGRALIRTYISSADPAVVMMNLMTSGGDGIAEHPANYLEIVTTYSDGTVLSTRNAEISDVLPPIPGHIVQERKGVRRPSKLKAAHDERASELLPRDPLYVRAEDFERVFDEFHERWCRHQVDGGHLTPSGDDPARLRPTVKTGLKGIVNFLNPFADNFTLPRLLVALVFGLVVPVCALLWLSGPGGWVIARLAAVTGVPEAACLTGCVAVVVTGVGLVAGLVFVTKAFIWSVVLTYVIMRSAGPFGAWTAVALSLWTGFVAGWAAGIRERRHRLA